MNVRRASRGIDFLHGSLLAETVRRSGMLLLLLAVLPGCSTFKSSNDRDISLERKQRKETAVREFEESRDLAEFEAAQSRWHERDIPGCRDRLESLLARHPQHLDARLLLAETLLAENRAQDAIRALEPALAAHAEDARVQYTMGLALDAANQSSRALSHYERAAKLQPDNELYTVVHKKAQTGPQARSAEERRPPAALPQAACAEQPAASDAKAAARSGEIIPTSYLETPAPKADKRPTDAILQPASIAAEFGPRQAQRSQKAEPAKSDVSAENVKPVDVAAGAPAKLTEQRAGDLGDGSVTAAVAAFRQAIAAKPDDPQLVISAAVWALQHNRSELALELIEPAIRKFPNSAALHRILGTAYYRRGDYVSSQRSFQQALSLDKSSALSYFLMGCTLDKLGQHDAAETHFRQAQLLDSRYAARRAGAAGSSPSTAW